MSTIRASAAPVLRPFSAPIEVAVLRAAVALSAGSAALGCGADPRPPHAGDDGWGPSLRDDLAPAAADETAPPAPRQRPIPEAERAMWPRAEELATWPQIGGRGPSEHLEGRFERTVVVDPSIAEIYGHLTIASVIPAGAVVLQRHHRPGSGAVVAHFGMERLAAGDASGDWRFFALDDELRVAADALTLCRRCHEQAPFHGLFGAPPGSPEP